jgi:hypothetical protein
VVYAPSGVGPYAFTFEILDQTDIAVYKASTLLTLTTDYTVTINANGTGSVTLVATAGTSNITIVGAKNIQRTTDFTTGGDLFANTLNDELDNQTIFIQQVAETTERGLKAPVTDPTDIAMTLPTKDARANRYLGFDSLGNPLAQGNLPDVAYYGALTANPSTRPNGTAMVSGDTYYNSALTRLYFFDGFGWTPIVSSQMLSQQYTATSGQTTFVFTAGYAPNNIFVFVNGALRAPTTYTATNGSSVVLSSGATAGDIVYVVAQSAINQVQTKDILNLNISYALKNTSDTFLPSSAISYDPFAPFTGFMGGVNLFGNDPVTYNATNFNNGRLFVNYFGQYTLKFCLNIYNSSASPIIFSLKVVKKISGSFDSGLVENFVTVQPSSYASCSGEAIFDITHLTNQYIQLTYFKTSGSGLSLFGASGGTEAAGSYFILTRVNDAS